MHTRAIEVLTARDWPQESFIVTLLKTCRALYVKCVGASGSAPKSQPPTKIHYKDYVYIATSVL